MRSLGIALVFSLAFEQGGHAQTPTNWESLHTRVEQLGDPDAALRESAAEALGRARSQDRAVIDALELATADPERRVAAAAFVALVASLPSSQDSLFRVLESATKSRSVASPEHERLESGELLQIVAWQTLSPPVDAPASVSEREASLRQGLEDPGPLVRAVALLLLRSSRDRAGLGAMGLALAEELPDSAVGDFLRGLRPFGDELFLHRSSLERFAHRPKSATQVVLLLVDLCKEHPEASTILDALLSSPTPATRAAVLVYADSVPARSVALLLADPEVSVRRAALSRVAREPGLVSVDRVEVFLEDPLLCGLAIACLARRGDAGRAVLWGRLADGGSPEFVRQIVRTLTSELATEGIPQLTEAQARLLLASPESLSELLRHFDTDSDAPALPRSTIPVLTEWSLGADRSAASTAFRLLARIEEPDSSTIGAWVSRLAEGDPNISFALAQVPGPRFAAHRDTLIGLTLRGVRGAARAWVRLASTDLPARRALHDTLLSLEPGHGAVSAILEAIAELPARDPELARTLLDLRRKWPSQEPSSLASVRTSWALASATVAEPTPANLELTFESGLDATARLAKDLRSVPESFRVWAQGRLPKDQVRLGSALLRATETPVRRFGLELHTRGLRYRDARMQCSFDSLRTHPDSALVPVIDEWLESNDPRERASALTAVADFVSLWWLPENRSISESTLERWGKEARAALDDPRAEVRRAAIRVLAGLGPRARGSLEDLLRLAGDDSLRDEVAAAVRCIGRDAIGALEVSALPFAREWIARIEADEDSKFVEDLLRPQRIQGIPESEADPESLPEIGVESRESALRLLRLRENPDRYLEAVCWIGVPHRAAVLDVDVLEGRLLEIACAEDVDPERRETALLTLRYSRSDSVAKRLEELLLHDVVPAESRSTIWLGAALALAGRGTDSLPALERLLSSPAGGEVFSAIYEMGERASPLLRRLAQDPDSRYGAMATALLASFEGGATDLVLGFLQSPDERLWQRGAQQLASWPPKDGERFLEELRELVRSEPSRAVIAAWLKLEKDEAVQVAVCERLLAEDETYELFRTSLGSGISLSPRLLSPVVEAFGAPRRRDQVPWFVFASSREFLELLTNDDPRIQSAAREAWRRLAASSVELLLEASSAESWVLRREVARLLPALPRDSVADVARRLLRDSNPQVRQTTFLAFGRPKEWLEELLTANDPAVRLLGVQLLSALDFDRSKRVEASARAVDPASPTREGTPRSATQAAESWLEHALGDVDFGVRRAAVETWSQARGFTPSDERIVALLADPEPRIRAETLRLAFRESARDVEPFRARFGPLLADPEPEVLMALAPVLRRWTTLPSDWSTRLLDLADDDRSSLDSMGRSHTVGEAIRSVLRQHEEAIAEAVWERILTTPREDVRARAAPLLPKHSLVPEPLRERAEELALESVTVFQRLCTLDGFDETLHRAYREGSEEVRRAAPWALRSREEFFPDLCAALDDRSSRVARSAAAVWAPDAELDRVLERTAVWLSSRDPALVSTALQALGMRFAELSEAQRRPLDRALHDESEEIRVAALLAIGRSDPPRKECAEICYRALSDSSREVRDQARWLLHRLRIRGVTLDPPPLATDLLAQPERWPQVVPLLEPLGENARPWIEPFPLPLDSADPEVRLAALHAATMLKRWPDGWREAVAPALHDPEPAVREAAVEAIAGRLDAAWVGILIDRARNDESVNVARKAMECLVPAFEASGRGEGRAEALADADLALSTLLALLDSLDPWRASAAEQSLRRSKNVPARIVHRAFERLAEDPTATSYREWWPRLVE